MTVGLSSFQSSAPTLTLAEKLQLEECEAVIARGEKMCQAMAASIEAGQQEERNSFPSKAIAFSLIRENRLYRETHESFEKYVREKFKIAVAHAKRIASAGALIEKMRQTAPGGAIVEKLTSEAHLRLLTSLTDSRRTQVLAKLAEWAIWKPGPEISTNEIKAAIWITDPNPSAPRRSGRDAEVLEKVEGVIHAVKARWQHFPIGVQILEEISGGLAKLAVRRTSGIQWTEKTWNPLLGCSRASAGCEKCYAARLFATRKAHLFPGLAELRSDGDAQFTGKLVLMPQRLGEPLADKTPSTIFVNSLSDLFHKDVPNGFIDAVFEVMESASWHTFQVLTKRPARMADYTRVRYAEVDPHRHIWLGTSVEDQKNFDERIAHLRNVKAHVRWLSAEPLLGPITIDARDGIDWLVVGGESQGGRKMEKSWAASLRDRCAELGIPYFFKQWGDHGEDGIKRKAKKGAWATIDSVVHHNFPKA